MTEEEARAWIVDRWDERSAARLEHFASLVVEENQRQNLISAASIPSIWARHLVDSAQLAPLAGGREGLWVDVGTGGGFPGMIVAALRGGDTLLVEPRRKRAEFLKRAVNELGLDNTTVFGGRVEALTHSADVISGRAVAAPEKFFALTRGVASPDTLFLLPSGRDAQLAVVEAERRWRGVFHVEQSVTEPASKIITATMITPR